MNFIYYPRKWIFLQMGQRLLIEVFAISTEIQWRIASSSPAEQEEIEGRHRHWSRVY